MATRPVKMIGVISVAAPSPTAKSLFPPPVCPLRPALDSQKRDFDDSSPSDLITDHRRLPVPVAVHAHPGDHFKKRPRQCGNVLVREVTPSRVNPDEAGEIGKIAPAHRGLIKPGEFCNLSGAAVE